MQIKWMLENDVFSEDLEPLKTEIIRQGFSFHEVNYIPFQGGSYDDIFMPNDCVIFYGSLNLALQLQREKNFHPYIYCTRQNYECLKYYAYFGQYLLNRNYVMLPYAELNRRKEWLFSTFGKKGSIFIRPSSGSKIFTGHLIYIETFDKDYELLGCYNVEPHATVVVAEPRNIIKEWRLIIADGQVISGCLYSDSTTNLKYEGIPAEVECLACRILSETEYEPDRVWTMDICQTKIGSLYLLEIGGFSCAGLYQCELEPIVKEVSRIAQEDQRSLI